MIVPKKLTIANIPTPIQKLSFDGCNFFIKRDDFSGLELSGNKVRKLDYLLYQARKEKADYVFTCGGDQSNHSRATAIAAISQGMKSKLFLWGKDSQKAEGNLFIDKFIESEIRFLNLKDYLSVNQLMEQEKIKYENKRKKVFLIPSGGSSELGIWGYINFIDELKKQTSNIKLKGILTAAGSGGTSAGLLVGSTLFNLDLKIFAVNVLNSADQMKEEIINLANKCIQKYKLNIAVRETQLEVLDGYSAEGYKNIADDKISLIKRFAKTSGIILDPVYTGKAFTAYYENFIKSKKTSDILFVHTGGFFGVFSKREKYLR